MSSSSMPPTPNWRTHPLNPFKHRNSPLPAKEQSRDQTSAVFANAVYYPNWRVYRQQPPSSLNLGYISHVFYAFASLQLGGSISLRDEYADTQIEADGALGCLNAFKLLKAQYPLLKVILSIGGGAASANFAEVARDRNSIMAFARNARELVDTYGLDGIDIDWEHPSNPQQGIDYVHLLAALRVTLPWPDYTLTSALPAGEWALRNIDVASASTHLDFINLMAYDFAGPWTQTAGHHAQLYTPKHPHNDAARTSGQSSVNYLVSKGVPSKKILLGIPAYGRSFLGSSKVGDRFTGHGGEEGTFEYKDLPRPGTREYVDEQIGAACCLGGDGGFVTYDNPRSVQLKAVFAKQARLGGLFYWTGTADIKGQRSLVETGYNTLHNL